VSAFGCEQASGAAMTFVEADPVRDSCDPDHQAVPAAVRLPGSFGHVGFAQSPRLTTSDHRSPSPVYVAAARSADAQCGSYGVAIYRAATAFAAQLISACVSPVNATMPPYARL